MSKQPEVSIVPYEECHEAAAARFNGRLHAKGVTFHLPAGCRSRWLPPGRDKRLYQEYFIATEGDEARGGFTLKHQDFHAAGQTLGMASFHEPVSEGIIDRRYAPLAFRFLRRALKENPRLFALGMGSLTNPFPKLLASAGWTMLPVPFFFKINHPFRFLRQCRFLRQKPLLAFNCDLAALSGIGSLGLATASFAMTRHRPDTDVEAKAVPRFEGWADRVWHLSKESCSLTAVRDAEVLNTLYPEASERFIKVRVRRESEVIGWAVLLDTDFEEHKQFGALRVGTLVDCMALPGEEANVAAWATRILRQRGVDLIIANQLHEVWISAMRSCGFFEGPTNFFLALSPTMNHAVSTEHGGHPRIHMNRGDGDGPIHL